MSQPPPVPNFDLWLSTLFSVTLGGDRQQAYRRGGGRPRPLCFLDGLVRRKLVLFTLTPTIDLDLNLDVDLDIDLDLETKKEAKVLYWTLDVDLNVGLDLDVDLDLEN